MEKYDFFYGSQLVENDTLPSLEAQLLDGNGNPLNLDLCSVKFHMSNFRGVLKIDRQAIISNVENGEVKVEWQEGDTDAVGTYKCEFEVNMPDGKVITIPNDGYFLISIVSELA